MAEQNFPRATYFWHQEEFVDNRHAWSLLAAWKVITNVFRHPPHSNGQRPTVSFILGKHVVLVIATAAIAAYGNEGE